MKTLIPLILSFVFVLSFVSCGDDDGNDLTKTRTVTIKVSGSDNLNISSIVIFTTEGESNAFQGINSNKWSKEFTYEGIIAVNVSAGTTNGLLANMVLQIIENNKVVKESKAEGDAALVATADY